MAAVTYGPHTIDDRSSVSAWDHKTARLTLDKVMALSPQIEADTQELWAFTDRVWPWKAPADKVPSTSG